MKTIDTTRGIWLPYLCQQLGLTMNPNMQVIACVRGDPMELIAGVVYDGYNGASIQAHIFIEEEAKPSKEWFVAIVYYPFVDLGIKKIIGQVNSSNRKAQKFDEKIGFEKLIAIPEWFPDGDMIIYSMTQEQCVILTSELWKPEVDKFIEKYRGGV